MRTKRLICIEVYESGYHTFHVLCDGEIDFHYNDSMGGSFVRDLPCRHSEREREAAIRQEEKHHVPETR